MMRPAHMPGQFRACLARESALGGAVVTLDPGSSEGAGDPRVGVFGDLEPEARRQLWAAAEQRHFEAGELVLVQGRAVDHLFIVASGLLVAEVAGPQDQPVEVARFIRGAAFGELAFLEGGGATATVTALTPCDLWAVPHSALLVLAEQHPSLLRELARTVAARLAQTNLRFRESRNAQLAAIVSDGSERASMVVERVALSAARHLANPVVLVDVSGGTAGEHDRRALEAAGRAGIGVEIVRPEPERTSRGQLVELMEALRARYGCVLLHTTPGYVESGWLGSHVGRAILLTDGREPAPEFADAARPLDQVILATGPEASRPAVRLQAPEPGRSRVVGVLPPGRELLGEHARREIDRVARHLIQRKVGLALGAGGAKGYAHVGVIRELEALGVPIDAVAGASIGAPVAAGVAAGRGLDYIKQQLDVSFRKALRRAVPVSSLMSSRGLASHLEEISEGRRFEELEVPLAIVAVDLATREEVVFTEGPVAEAMLASMAIPGIFPPVRRDGQVLVDGALLHPIPSSHVRALGADVVIAVKLTGRTPIVPQTRRLPSLLRAPPIVDTILGAFDVMQTRLTEESLMSADVIIEPVFAGPVALRDFGRGDEFIQAGATACMRAVPELGALLPWTLKGRVGAHGA